MTTAIGIRLAIGTIAAALGAGAFAALAALPPGTGAGRPRELLTAVVRSREFSVGLAFAATTTGVLLLLYLWRRRRSRLHDLSTAAGAGVAHVAEPLLWGAAAPLASLLLDPWSFHRTVWVTAFTGLALGALVAGARARTHGLSLRLRERHAVAVIACLAVAIPTLLALPGPPWFHPLSGDEPHYLVTARSLRVDGDVDVANEYNERLTQPFWRGELPPHSKPGRIPGSRYPIHGIGLSLWLAPWYGLGRDLSETGFNVLVRFAMSLWLAAAAIALFHLLRDLAGRRAAITGTMVATLTLPLLFAGPHLFPAVPVFALSCAAWVLLRRRPGPAGAAAAGIMLACLPWLHFKFFGLMAAIASAGVWFLLRDHAGVPASDPPPRRAHQDAAGPPGPPARSSSAPARAAWRPGPALAALGAPLLLSGIGHLLYTRLLYGSYSPLAIHVGADPTRRATGAGDDLLAYLTDPLGALTTGVGYFLDQREGLLFYAPHYLLALAGLAWLTRRRRADAVVLAAALASVVVPYALSQETGHWAPPARPLTGVLWTLAAGIGIGLVLPAGAGGVGRLRAALRAVLVTWGACATVLLLLQADLLYHDYGVPRSLVLLRYGAPGLPLADLAPLWLGPEAVRWGVSLVGLALVVGVGALLWRWGSEVATAEPGANAADTGRSAPQNARTPIAAAAAFIGVAAVLMLAHRAAVPLTDLHQAWTFDTVRFWKPVSPPTRAWADPEGVWTGSNDTVRLLLSSPAPLEQLVLELDALVPLSAEVQLGRDRRSLSLDPERRQLARLQPGPGRRWRGEYFYHLEVVAHGGASVAALGRGSDTTGLGVHLRPRQVETGSR